MTGETRKVLICSSEPDIASVFAQHNPFPYKYSVVELRDTSQLIQKVYDEMPHLIVVDIHPSDVAAFDLCGQMKLDVILCHIPLVVVTDSTKSGTKIDCGADLYLSKPVNGEELCYHADRIVTHTIDELDINPLTHMPGNRSTVRRIEMLIAEKRNFAVCCLDLKNLHVYNEAYGVHRGDFLIRETANILRETIAQSPADTFVGHLGGDDFIIITTSERSAEISERVIEQFDKSIHKFYERVDRERGYMVVKGQDSKYHHHSFVCLSIAIVTNDLIRYDHVAEITKTASQIQHYLKRFPASAYLKDRRSDIRQPVSLLDMAPAGIRQYQPDEAAVKERGISKRSEMMAAVAGFLKSEEIDTFLQPIVHMPDRRVHGYEALSRFRTASGALLDPGLIFHAAREANVIREFDVLCAKRALINNEGLPRDKKLFINLNRETLMNAACLDEILKASRVPFDQIVIELTEQSLLTEIDQIMASVDALRSKGLQFAIDDMGGGSVSLREAATLRPDYIKFDGSLIRDIVTNETKQKILLSLLVFAKGIGAKTTAEGIETKAEIDWLQSTGIDFGQGFFIAKPAKIHFAQV